MSLWEAIKDFFRNYADYQVPRKDGAESTEAALGELGEETCVNCGSGRLKKNGVETWHGVTRTATHRGRI